jgi:hypothetical protein
MLRMYFLLFAIVVIVVIVSGCVDPAEMSQSPVPCTESWYEYVESIIPTGDGMGHGPDIGSDEWKSVVEFKLGIRNDPGVPERSSEAWCQYMDQRIPA